MLSRVFGQRRCKKDLVVLREILETLQGKGDPRGSSEDRGFVFRGKGFACTAEAPTSEVIQRFESAIVQCRELRAGFQDRSKEVCS